MGQKTLKFISRSAVFLVLLAGALGLIVPPIMVLYLEGPVWPAIQFAAIQAFLVLMCVFTARGYLWRRHH